MEVWELAQWRTYVAMECKTRFDLHYADPWDSNFGIINGFVDAGPKTWVNLDNTLPCISMDCANPATCNYTIENSGALSTRMRSLPRYQLILPLTPSVSDFRYKTMGEIMTFWPTNPLVVAVRNLGYSTQHAKLLLRPMCDNKNLVYFDPSGTELAEYFSEHETARM